MRKLRFIKHFGIGIASTATAATITFRLCLNSLFKVYSFVLDFHKRPCQQSQHFGNWFSFKHCSGDYNPANIYHQYVYMVPKYISEMKRSSSDLPWVSTNIMNLTWFLFSLSILSLSPLWQGFFSTLFCNCQRLTKLLLLWKMCTIRMVGLLIRILVEFHLATGNSHISNPNEKQQTQ